MVDVILRQELLCSICMEIYLDPVTLRCGHSFCMTCICRTWDNQVGEYTCPECRAKLRRRPEVRRNLRLGNIAEYVRSLEAGQEETGIFCSYSPDLTFKPGITTVVDNSPSGVNKTAEKVFTNATVSPEVAIKHYYKKGPENIWEPCHLQEETKKEDFKEAANHNLKKSAVFIMIKEDLEEDYLSYHLKKLMVHLMQTSKLVEIGEKVHSPQERKSKDQGKTSNVSEKVDVLLRKLKDQVESTFLKIQSDISKYKEKVSSTFSNLVLIHTSNRTEL